jgi:mRNA deadenylase 3'-5' endonuclease subunit Ccr4
MSKRTWSHRQSLIRERLLHSAADIICIQEADGDSFDKDFGFMEEAGYGHVLHNKFRFRCATFYKADKFALENVGHKDRSLVTSLRSIDLDDRIVNVANCHLSGGAAPERRLRQVHDALEQIRKWKDAALLTLEKQRKAKRPSPKNIAKAEELFRCHEEAGAIVCGDFNSDGNTAVRRLLVEGSVDPEWREEQYAAVPLTSKRREQVHTFVDAAELAYASNVCDGDYGEVHGADGCRPATYVVPNLASLLLSTIDGEDIPRTEFGHQVAKGLANTLSLEVFCENEIEQAFESVDLDGNGIIDEDEVQQLLESVYVAMYGKTIEAEKCNEKQIEEEKEKFFGRFHVRAATTLYQGGLSLEQFTERLLALQQELEGGSEGSELVKIKTEADAQRMIGRFSPTLRDALDYVFDEFCTSDDDSDILSEEDVAKFLIKVNGQLGRGGIWLYTTAIFEKKKDASMPAILTRQDWYGAFARELGEGKWWQVVYDLEICGADLRSKVERDTLHYQGWLDYVYFDSQRLSCAAVQEALTAKELSHIHDKGDALPNEWHPSDHLPVATVLSWRL